MTSLVADIANDVRARFNTLVAVARSLKTVFDNQVETTVPAEERWCRFAVQLGLQQQVTTGGPGTRRFRTVGVALAQLFEPIGQGDGSQLEIVAAIQDAFRNVSLPGLPHITFDPPYVSAPPVREDSWWQCVVAIPFRADEFA